MSVPRLSVVIPTYNRAFCIAQAIDSALAQTYNDREVIVVDDGSTDETPRVLGAYGDRILVIRQENRGASAARNRGVHQARGQWVAFLDSDDEWVPNKLELQMALAGRCDDLVSVTCNFLIQDGEGKWIDSFVRFGHTDLIGRESRLGRPFRRSLNSLFITSSMIYRRRILLEVGGFDERLSIYDDYDLVLRTAVRGPMGVVGEPLARVARKGDAAQALSAIARRRSAADLDGVLIAIFQNLLREGGLDRAECRALRRELGSRLCRVGEAKVRDGFRREGAEYLLRSIHAGRSAGAVVRVAAMLLLGARRIDQLRFGRRREALNR